MNLQSFNLQSLGRSRPLRLFLSAIIVGCVSLICYRVFGVNAITAGFAYLLCVLGIAANWGLPESLVASAIATACFSYFFLPPIGRLVIADPSNWIALFTFLATALVASHLSDRAKKEALDARSRERESGLLYKLSRATLLNGTQNSVGLETARNLAEIFSLAAVHLYNTQTGEMAHAGSFQIPRIESLLIETATSGILSRNGDVLIAPVRAGDHGSGSLAMQGLLLSSEALDALLNLVAIAFERAHALHAANRAEAARQSEEFKSTLLDAITHEFKTPLTSIKAASTAILTEVPAVGPHIHELAAIIEHGADRLNLLVTDAVRMAQMDASMMHLELKPIQTGDFIRRVLTMFESRCEDRSVSFHIPDHLPLISADPDLASLALRHVIDNALKYSAPGSPLRLAAESSGTAVTIRVRDHGPGITEIERSLIFERFYRQPGVKDYVPGGGLGLYIAREITRAHGGDLWAEQAPECGAEFCMTLPKAIEAAQ